MKKLVIIAIITLTTTLSPSALNKADCATCWGTGGCQVCDASGKAWDDTVCVICEGSKKCYVCEGSGEF